MLFDDEKKRAFEAFLSNRWSSDRARAEWRADLEAGHRALLSAKVAKALDKATLFRALDAATEKGVLEGVSRPLGSAIAAELLPRLRKEEAVVGDLVPDEARAKIDQLLALPGLVNEKLVREITKQEAIEEIMRDVLYDALKEFNDKVNPFFADWGLPALVKKLMPIGSGTVLKSLDNVRGEFDKRLDPEMRKFLLTFSRKSLDRTADVIIEKGDEPKSIELRKAIARWLYTQKVKDLAVSVSDEGAKLSREAAESIAAHASRHELLIRAREDVATTFFSRHADHTVAEALAAYGVDFTPDFDLIAELTWPAVVHVVQSGVVGSRITALVAEFFAADEKGAT